MGLKPPTILAVPGFVQVDGLDSMAAVVHFKTRPVLPIHHGNPLKSWLSREKVKTMTCQIQLVSLVLAKIPTIVSSKRQGHYLSFSRDQLFSLVAFYCLLWSPWDSEIFHWMHRSWPFQNLSHRWGWFVSVSWPCLCSWQCNRKLSENLVERTVICHCKCILKQPASRLKTLKWFGL